MNNISKDDNDRDHYESTRPITDKRPVKDTHNNLILVYVTDSSSDLNVPTHVYGNVLN